MLLVLLFSYCFGLSISQLCPHGSVQLPQDNGCATIQQTGDHDGFFQAEALCQESNGHLISIHNAFANAMLVAYATGVSSSMDTLYIGGDNYRNNEYSWIDKSTMNYTNWVAGEPSSQGNCMALRLSDGKWFVTDCHLTLPFICEIPGLPTTSTVPPTTQYTACPTNWTMYNENCYNMFFPETYDLLWSEARDLCRKQGADLPSIHSAEEDAFILDFCRSLPKDPQFFPWTGLTFDDEYHWSDGSNVTYLNVKEKIPNYNPALYDFASAGPYQGQWDDNDANDEDTAAAYICKRPVNRIPMNNRNL